MGKFEFEKFKMFIRGYSKVMLGKEIDIYFVDSSEYISMTFSGEYFEFALQLSSIFGNSTSKFNVNILKKADSKKISEIQFIIYDISDPEMLNMMN